MRRIFVLMAFAGCVEAPTEGVATSDIISPIHEPQGRGFLGDNLDLRPGMDASVLYSASRTFTWAGVGHDLVVTDACLALASAPQTCLDFTALGVVPRSTGSDGANLKITDTHPYTAQPVPNALLYRVKIQVGTAWQDLCDAPGSTGFAFPIAGEWNTGGAHVTTRLATRLSFACEDDGVVAKAVQWGDAPGRVSTAAIWQEHQTAVRMGRADYCYAGDTHTFKNTPIGIYDDSTLNLVFPVPHVVPPLAPGAQYFEAGWRQDTNTEGSTVVCLSKLRWSTIPFGSTCGGLLVDPRVSPETGKYCDDYTLPELAAAGMLFNTSSFNDLGLYRWANNGDIWTTTRGLTTSSAAGPQPDAPAAGYAFTGARECNVITDDGKAVLVGTGAFEAINSYTLANGHHVLTTSSSVPAGATFANTEGWVWKSAPSLPSGFATTPLYRCKNPTTGEFLTTTSLSACTAGGYTNHLLLGHCLQR